MLLAQHVLQTGAVALAPALSCSSLLPRLRQAAAGKGVTGAGSSSSSNPTLLQQCRGLLWSVEKEQGHTYKDPSKIINDAEIHAAMEKTQSAAKDKTAIQAILDAAKERSFLTNYTPGVCLCVCVCVC